MKCEECQKLGVQSKVFVPAGGFRTAMGGEEFYDEIGHHHIHDPNISMASWSCSGGHEWVLSQISPCPVTDCDWNARHAPLSWRGHYLRQPRGEVEKK